MTLIADALLIAGALGAALYCRTLARRLGALKDLDSGLGAAIAALSRQVDELRASLDAAKSVSGDQTREIAQLTARAEMAAGRLELLLASLHEGETQRPVGSQTARQRGGVRPAAAERRTETQAAGAEMTEPHQPPQTPEASGGAMPVADSFSPIGRHTANARPPRSAAEAWRAGA